MQTLDPAGGADVMSGLHSFRRVRLSLNAASHPCVTRESAQRRLTAARAPQPPADEVHRVEEILADITEATTPATPLRPHGNDTRDRMA